MKPVFFILSVLCLALAFVGAAGQTVQAAPVKVNRCDAKHNPGSMGGPAYVGYTRGYYPGSPYYWRDPYRMSYYQPAVSPSAALYIDFVNATPNVMSVIDFGLVARGHLIAEVRDVGTFSPGVEIKHEFGVNPNVFPLGTALPECPALYIEFANGTKWTNPHLPAMERSLYR
jgi:hypothetical protein